MRPTSLSHAAVGPEPVRQRPGSSSPRSPLIERTHELEAIEDAVARLGDRSGGVVFLEGAAGLGKTALLDHAGRLAAEAGALVRPAAPGPLERHFPYGVVRALLEAPLRDARERERRRLLDGVARRAGELLLDGGAPSSEATTMLAHSVFWLCSALAERRPLALIVDDAQWADRTSLEVLSFAGRRAADLPLLLVVAARTDDPDAATDLLSLLGDGRAATVLQPRPLTTGGGVRLIRRLAPDTPIDVCRRCQTAAQGNPWLLSELGRQIAAHGPAILDDRDTGAQPVSAVARGVVRRRLAALGPRDRAVVDALSVIGDCAAPHVVAAVASVPVAELGQARDALVAAGLLGPDGARFAHALIATVISEELPRSERERLHREAARALIAAGADADAVASHLLRSAPRADAEVSAFLDSAAREAWERGAPQATVAYLQRAADERAPGDDRGRILAQLATIAYDAGLPTSTARMREALTEAGESESRLEVLTRLAAFSAIGIGDGALADRIEHERETEDDPQRQLALEAAALDSLVALPERQRERARRVEAADPAAAADPLVARALLSHRAWLGAERGTLSAEQCAQLARDALADDTLLAEVRERAGFHLALRVLIHTDHPDEAQRAIDALRAEACDRGSTRPHAAAGWYTAELALRSGRVADAEAAARTVLELGDPELNVFSVGALSVLVRALAERGAFDEAHALLAERDVDGSGGEIGALFARARLALAEGDFERAHADAVRVGALREHQGRPNPTWTAWRSTAALALAHLGRRDEAVELADAELVLAERFGAPAPIAAALHARMVAEDDEREGLAIARRVIAIDETTPGLLDATRVRVRLGTTLRRMGKRLEARAELRHALADADSAGATLLADHARRELVATGLRPRRAQTQGPAALTPRQREVSELAAAGVPNREIAQRLFLSVKTVETHLAASYRKLGVETRDALAGRLGATNQT